MALSISDEPVEKAKLQNKWKPGTQAEEFLCFL